MRKTNYYHEKCVPANGTKLEPAIHNLCVACGEEGMCGLVEVSTAPLPRKPIAEVTAETVEALDDRVLTVEIAGMDPKGEDMSVHPDKEELERVAESIPDPAEPDKIEDRPDVIVIPEVVEEEKPTEEEIKAAGEKADKILKIAKLKAQLEELTK